MLVSLTVLLFYWGYSWYFDPGRQLKFYPELKELTQSYPASILIDSFRRSDHMLISSRPSNPYKFIYVINIGKYDSIFYYGEYPSLVEAKRNMDPVLYKEFKRCYWKWYLSYNNSVQMFSHNTYVLYALFYNGDVDFYAMKRYSKNISVNGYDKMRSGQKFKVSGENIKYGNRISTNVYLEPVDNIYKRPAEEYPDSLATDVK